LYKVYPPEVSGSHLATEQAGLVFILNDNAITWLGAKLKEYSKKIPAG